ncbi:gliding motility-associated C-terminal domain-containing protein [Hymenobacter bucti]|uniref:Gliding motility-associated C-terminal domain-containing protein n=1 Tax=Hymenobacter bucti TaxID=1844114 RepID=A0ABW4QYV0_9BACT
MALLLPCRPWYTLLLLLLLACAGRPAQATHLLGGELTYRYLDANGPAAAPLRYEITVTIYNNCNIGTAGVAAPNNNANVAFYNQATGAKLVLTTVNYPTVADNTQTGIMNIASTSLTPTCISPKVPTGCTITGVSQPFRLQKFIGIVNLPISASGYYAVYTRSARNVDVTNLSSPSNQALTLYATLAPPSLPNRSPVFSDTAVAIICQGDTTILLNNAVDADGDRLAYSFGNPYGAFSAGNGVLPAAFTPLPPRAPYAAGYGATTPFGTANGNYASINAATGIAKYRAGPTSVGSKYVVAVDVSEYRTVNGREVLIGTTRRDLQLVVANCPSTTPPVLPPATTTPRSYTIEEGSALSIPITATQADNHPLVLTLNSRLLDGAGGYNAALGGNQGTVVAGNPSGTASVVGTGTVAGTFVYNSACGEARAAPYDLALTVKDNGCGGKTVADLLRITVTRAAGPTAISGSQVVCALNSAYTYSASGGTAPGVRWRVVGGTIVGSNGGRSVQVQWTAAGPGTLVAKGLSQYGCLTDSVSQAITVAPAPALAVTGNLAICQGASTTLTVAGGGGPYTLTGGPAALTGAGPFVVSPAQTTTYTVTGAPTSNGCTSSAQVTVAVAPLPAATVGGATRTTCSGVPITLGAPAVTGNTYSWSPTTGLSSSTVANPVLTFANATSATITQTYTLTVTNTASACTSMATVVVSISPAASVSAGPAQAVCDKQTITLGAPAQPGYSYLWAPATNLSSATAAQPTLTGANTTGAPLVQKYVLVASTALGCVAKDSVLVTINPRPATDSIVGAASVCPTVAGVVYTVRNPRATAYQWAVVGGTIGSGQGTATITVDWGAAGAGAVRVYATNALGCLSEVVLLPVIINQRLQTVKPTGPTSVCQTDGPYPYQTLLVTGSSYAWQLFGTAQGTLVNTLNKTSINFSQPGLAKLVVTETSNPAGGICRGVSDTLYITVQLSPAATLAIQGPARFCMNSGAVTYSLPGALGSTYVFQLNGTAVASVGNSVIIPTSTAVGTYTLTARETNANGCAGPLYTKQFVVDPRPGAIAINGPRFVCPASGSLTYVVPNATAGSTYQWAVVGGTIAAGQGTASLTVSFTAGTTAPKTISVTESSAVGCAGAPVTITVVPDNAEAPSLTVASVNAQDNSKVDLTFSVASAQTTPNPVRVLRRPAGSTAAFAQVGTAAATTSAYTDATAAAAQTAYDYRLELTNGCGDVLSSLPATTIHLVAVATPGLGGRSQGSVQLIWTAYQGFPVSSYQVYQQNDKGAYALVVTVGGTTLQATVPNGSPNSAAGTGFTKCFRIVALSAGPGGAALASNSNAACVDFANKLTFYNIITPNGDGQNDVLIIDNVTLYPGNSISIFNRWGREVYSATNYQNNWGQEASTTPGTYYYLFKLADGTATKGWVEVVK